MCAKSAYPHFQACLLRQKLLTSLHTDKRADNDDEVEHIPCFLEIMHPQRHNLDNGLQHKYASENEIANA